MSFQPTPSSGFVHLILFSREGEDHFFLEIPIDIASAACLYPRKYLRYLGWCVLGVEGALVDGRWNAIPLNGELLDRGIYRYIVPGENPLAHAVDLEVIKQRSQVRSETTATREDFRSKLLARDGCCVWTGLDGVGMHIIPYRRGEEWLQLIIDNRPHLENLESLSINDIRNGIYADDNLHNHHFDPRNVVVLKTPNPILDTIDIPDRAARLDVDPSHSFPETSRYTLQWIVSPTRPAIRQRFPNNNDATFFDQNLPKPAELLLHYNYGAAVVKQWGRNICILTNRPGIPRPAVPTPAPMGPTRFKHDRHVTVHKRAVANTSQQGQAADKDRGTGESAAADSGVQDGWDEDDVMLFFWGNSKVARERITQKEQAHNGFIENWRAVVTRSPRSA